MAKIKNPIRFRFENAAEARAVEARVATKSDIAIERDGKVLTISTADMKILSRNAKAEGVTGYEVAGRGRPKAGEESSVRTVGAEPEPQKKGSVKKPAKRGEDLSSRPKGRKEKEEEVPAKKKKKDSIEKTARGKKLSDQIEMHDGSRSPRRPTARTVAKGKSTEATSKKNAVKESSNKTRPVISADIVSSQIEKVWFNLKTNAMTVKFHHTESKYRYSDVSFKSFKEFMLADSQGSYFANNIKGIYEYVKLKAR